MTEAIEELFAAVQAGELEPIVGGEYPLADARRAHEDIRGRRRPASSCCAHDLRAVRRAGRQHGGGARRPRRGGRLPRLGGPAGRAPREAGPGDALREPRGARAPDRPGARRAARAGARARAGPGDHLCRGQRPAAPRLRLRDDHGAHRGHAPRARRRRRDGRLVHHAGPVGVHADRPAGALPGSWPTTRRCSSWASGRARSSSTSPPARPHRTRGSGARTACTRTRGATS